MPKRLTYRCAECNEVFESAWSDEEAQAEKQRLWGDMPDEEMAVVCEVCFERLLRRDAR